MTNQEILKIALEQSALDCNCKSEDFLRDTNVVVLSTKNPKARVYLPLPFACDLVSYGSNIVAQVGLELVDTVTAYIEKYPVAHCFETPHLHALDQALAPFGLKICFMAEYFLPDVNCLSRASLSCQYPLKTLTPPDFSDLYLPQWSNALCEARKEYDVLAVGAYDGEKLIGLAGCSADCETMYQIGVDVLPAYRKQGVASALTRRLALEILALGKVPFYCAAWSNLPSVKNALKSGFRPAWVEVSARDRDFVEKMNL